MKIEREVKVVKEINCKYLKCKIGCRYYEDGSLCINGEWFEDDNKEPKVPCYEGGYWSPIIDIDEGKIINWTKGIRANIHYKSCDDNYIQVMDDNDVEIYYYIGYVPKILCPDDEGFGDYVIMRVDDNGYIIDWKKEELHQLFKCQNFAHE